MTSTIRRLASLVLLALAAVAPALVYYQVIAAGDLTARQDNPRRLAQELRIQRGLMFDRQGRILVENRIQPDGRVQRVYGYPSLVHVTGFFSPRFGAVGMESSYNSELKGSSGADSWQALEARLLGNPVIGDDLALTVDLGLQQAVEKAMGNARGAALVLDPRTGEVLALYSRPYFDPNPLAVLDPGPATDTYWSQLNQDADHPLVNRATQGLYPPGSTFKTVTLAASLEAGLAKLDGRYSFTLRPADRDHQYAWHANEFTSCDNHPQTNSFDLRGAYGLSCNIVFSELGLKIGAPVLQDYARRFGFESKPPLEVPVEASRFAATGDYFTGDERFYALASTAFGQGELLATPLQMALVAAAAASGGSIPTPHLVSQVRDRNGQVLSQIQPSVWRRAMAPGTASLVKEAMVWGGDQGWANGAKPQGVSIGGKTGTAENATGNLPHAWFIGFAPADNPRVVVALVKEAAGSSTAEADPVAKAIFQAALDVVK